MQPERLSTLQRLPQEIESMLRKVARYTRFVLFGKWFLAVVSLLILMVLVIWPMVSRDSSGVRISVVSGLPKALDPTSKPVMQNPNYQGIDNKGQNYTVTALRAIQESDSKVLLEAVKAELFLQDQSWMSLSAARAEFLQDSKLLTLLGGVKLQHDGGFTVNTPTARIDTNTSIASGEAQVVAEGPMGKLLATGFEIRDNGDYMKFGLKGRVNVQIKRSQPRPRE
jgi:lipopolysaccharide export system protein LptC